MSRIEHVSESISPTHRDSSLDILRVLAAFAVVWLHAASRVVAINPDTHSANWWFGNFYDALSRWCVPIFIMISGALLLARTVPIADFYQRRLAKLGIPIVFWTLFYVLVDNYRGGESFDPAALFKSIVLGTPHYHLWYLYMIVGLYLVTPFIRNFVETASSQLIVYFIGFCLIASSVESIWGSAIGIAGNVTFISSFLPFVGYFVLGCYLQKATFRASNIKLASSVLGLALLIALLVGVLFPFIGEKSWGLMYAYLNPLVILMSCSVYVMVTKWNIRSAYIIRAAKDVAPLTLGIYVIHPVWLAALNKFVHLPFVGIPITSLIVFLLSLASALVMSKVPVLKKTI